MGFKLCCIVVFSLHNMFTDLFLIFCDPLFVYEWMGEGLFSFGRRSSRSFVSSFFIPFPIICGHFDEEVFSSLFDFASFYFFIVLSCVESDGEPLWVSYMFQNAIFFSPHFVLI